MSKILIFLAVFFGAALCAYAGNDVLPYDYSSVYSIPIKLSITKAISTKEHLIEGQDISFVVKYDVRNNGKILLHSGDVVNAKIETVITSGMNGFPAEIIIDDFNVSNIGNSKLLCTYTKAGQNRSLLVYPLKWALTPIPFAGTVTNFIKGGHAKIKPDDTVVIYYFPDWK